MGNWTVPPPKLDTEQKEFLEKHLFSGNKYWISGFPGSGKSTLLSHAIRLIKADKPKASTEHQSLWSCLPDRLLKCFKQHLKRWDWGISKSELCLSL